MARTHFFTDPARMAAAVDGIAAFLIANVEGIDADIVTESPRRTTRTSRPLTPRSRRWSPAFR